MSALKSECRKFSPNVFNKTKCQNCFRTKDAHSVEALENNRASRIVSKCGYLFVAPDWDFNVSVNRTKRWQRRWFVLFDDGELTYALDEFPDTIPQGTIDMNKVLDVSDAESVTGNEFAISITTQDKVHFIKGTSREESKWWFDVLSRVLPRHLSRGKHKRNATFPCGKATIPTTAVIAQDYCSEDDIRVNNYGRPKFLSSSEIPRNEKDWISSVDAEEDEDVFPAYLGENNSDNENTHDVEIHNALNKLISQSGETEEVSEGQSHQHEEKIQKDPLFQLEELDARRRNRRYMKRENRIQRSQRSRNDGVSKMIPSKNRPEKNVAGREVTDLCPKSNGGLAIAAAEKLEYLESIHANDIEQTPARQKIVLDEKEKSSSVDASNSKSEGSKPSSKTNLRKSESLKNIPSETQSEIRDHVSGLRRYHSFKGSSSHRKIKPSNGTSSLKRTKLPSAALPRSATSTPTTTILPETTDAKANSNVNALSPPDICYEHTSDGEFMRTGWLMRQTLTKDWSKHWFVLRDSSLTYYRDPSAEHCGIMDGILDLNQVSTIRDTESDRYYAFSLRMWDGKKHVLAAEADDFRSMWIQALQYASNLWSSASKGDFICSEIVLPEHTFHHTDRSVDRISSPSSLSSVPYIYDNNLVETSSTSSDDQSEYFSLVDEDEVSELSSSPRTLPPSPPINRNMMSLVKEKSRIRSCSGLKTPPTLSTGMESIIGHNADESNTEHHDDTSFSIYKDTLDSTQQDEIDLSELSSEVMNCDRIISPVKLSAESQSQLSEDSERMQFKLEFEDHLPRNEPTTETDNRNHDASVYKYSNTSTPKAEKTDECPICVNVKSKLVAAKEEIRKLKKELKEAHANFDNLEMFSYKLAQDIKVKEENYNSQIALMTAKIDDLTSKFTLAEKNYRQLKQKALKSESKERKRSSLKNREGLSLTKEYELKLCDLEKKIGCLETTLQRESPEVDDGSKNLQSDSQPKLEEISIPSESSDTSTSTELSSSCSTKGFFSRLQSLGSRVKNVNDLVSVKNKSTSDSGNPKICLERDTEGVNRLDESDDSWSLTLNNSLKTLNKYLDKHPNNLSDCHSVFIQKISKTLRWLKSSLDNICKQGIKSNNLIDNKLLLVHNLIGLLDSFCSNTSLNSQESMETKWSHAILLTYESMRILYKIDNVDSVDSLVKLDVAELAFKIIIRTLCTAFAEYENLELANVLKLISEIPQIRFFCPIVNKLFPKSQEEIENFNSASERLQQLNSQRTFILKTLQEAKKVRYESLWNILSDIPVQDASVSKPQTPNSILGFVTSIATSVHRIAEQQLCTVQYQSSYLLKTEQAKVHAWCLTANEALKSSVNTFMDEFKEQCPMIHESSVSVFELSDITRKEISCYVSELSFFTVSYSVLNSLLSHPSETTDVQNDDHLFNSLNDEDRVDNFPNTFLNSADFFSCPQCSTLRNFLSCPNQELNWSDYIEKYNFYSPRKMECLNFKLEGLSSDLSDACANCDSHLAESVTSNLKDVCNNLTCAECDKWIKKFCASEKQHELERQDLELKYSRELQQLEECLIKSSEVHEQEMLQKETELESTTAELQCLKIEYEEQIRTLKNLYEQKLHFDCDNIDEDGIRQVYKAEIEDLKDMFKKGLVAIENSHYRITTEMEKKHNDEISILKAEKERALELEAQATVTALEAIKKNHEQQLKQETALIKEDLMRKFQTSEHNKTFYDKYGNDLEKLKAEILNITEMYSAKCIENVALEEKVNSLRHQLEEAHNELCGLLKKNKEIDLSLVHI